MAKEKSTDVTKTGPIGLKGIRGTDLYNKLEEDASNNEAVASVLNTLSRSRYFPGEVGDIDRYFEPTEETNPEWKKLGKSTYDSSIVFGNDPSVIDEYRADRQSGFVQAFNGIAKGVTTAATTFIDGTAGLIWGLGQGIYNATTDSKDGSFEGLFNNDVSNSMRALNQYMEEVLPNYRTKDEIENPWALRNVFSVNTIADDFLKNLGFTVGAFYSGGAYLGALKGLGTLVRAGRMSETAARTISSIMNGLSEGRIEAGNLYDEQIKTEMGNLQSAYNEEMARIDAMPDTLVPLEGGGFYSPKQQAKLELAERFKEAQADIEDRASNAAVADMIGNTLYLGASEFWTFGKLYGSKFAKRAELANRTKTTGKKGLDLVAEDAARTEGAAGRIQRNATGYEAMKRPTKKAVLSGLGVGALEGAEEMNQAFMSSTFGNMYTPDSPDAYYKALTEDEYNIRSKDFMTALKDGFAESWGNSDTYKEGAIGFLTGILGMPTFGRAQNSSNETYLGKGKTVGISGGIFGKIAENRALNNQAEQEVSTLNKFVRKVKDTEDFFTRMTAFQDAMDGYSAEKNQFEYQNASDNDMFNGIDAFARTGRLGDLKELVTEDFENLSDERLSDIAHNTESDSNEWRNEDGTYMSDTEDGRQKMRQELSKRRDSILESIDEYEQSLADVRYIAGNALDDDQTRELAWLDWKGKQFTKRFNDVRQDVTSFATRLVDTINAFKRGRGRGMLDENTEEGRNIATQIETFGTLLNFIKEENITPLALGHFLNSNKEVADLLEDDIWETILEDLSGMDSKTYKDNVSKLKDLAKIGQAAVQFNDRFKEFTSNPSALIGNRQKIEKTTARTNEARNNANTLSNVSASTIQQLAQGIQEGQVVPDEIRAILDNDSTPSDVADDITQKLDEAERIVNEVDRIERALQAAAADPNIDQQAVADAQAMLERAAQVAENAEQLLDMSSETYNNADAILSEDEVAAAMSAAQSVEEGEAALQELAESRIAGAQTVLANIERQLRDADERAANLPTSEGAKSGEQPEEQQSIGHDSVTTTPSINRGQQQQGPEQQAQPTAYEQEAAAALEESGIPIQPSDRQKVVKDLANLFFTIDNLVRGNQDVRVIAPALKALPQYQDLAHIIGLDNLNRILNNKVGKSRIAAGQEQVPQQGGNENRQAPVDPDRLITPEISDTRVENQIAQEASRPLTSIPSGPINYWKTTLPRLSPYASRGDRRTFIDWAKSSNRFTPQQIKRMETIYDFLVSRGAFDNVDNGAVSTKVGSRNKPKVKFVSFQSVNREAGETVIFMMDEQGRILGDLGSLNDASTDRQVGLVNFLKSANQEYQQKIDAGATDDMVELSGETTVLQNMIGKVPYTATTDRRTLNTIWGDKPFTLAVARTSGANSQMIASSRTLSSGQSELEASIISPLDAVAGQPYVLVETSDPNSGRHFVPVPFNMPPLNTQTAESSLGKVIRSIFDAIPKGDWKAIKMPLMEFLAIQNASVKYSNDGATVQYISVQKQDGTWVKLYDGAANWEGAADKAFRTLLSANIPFQINRKYINSTFMGVSYNRMIGELAETNLPVGGTHTVGDWFTVNPVGQQGSYIQTTGLNPNRNNGQARVVGQEIMYKGVSYTVVPNTWEVFDKDGNRVTGDTTHIVARVQCAYNGYDITKPGPYQTSVGLYNPVEDKFVQQPSTKNISDIQNQKSELQQKAARGILTSVDLDDLLLEAVRNNNREAATALEDILVPIITDGKYNGARYTRDDRTRFSQIRGKYIHILQNREPSFKVGDEITGVNYDAEGREVGNWTTKVTKVFDNGSIETEGGVQYSSLTVKKFFGIGRPFTQGAHSLIVHNSRLGDNIPLYNSDEQSAETTSQVQQSQISSNDILTFEEATPFGSHIQVLVKNTKGIYVPLTASLYTTYIVDNNGTTMRLRGGSLTDPQKLAERRVISVQDGSGGYMEVSVDNVIGISQNEQDVTQKFQEIATNAIRQKEAVLQSIKNDYEKNGYPISEEQMTEFRQLSLYELEKMTEQTTAQVARPTQWQNPNQNNLLDKVQDSLDTDEKKAIWDLLNDDQKQQVANMSSKKRDQFFDEVEEEIFDDGEFNGDVNEYLPGGSRYSRVDERPKSRVWNEKKEKKWLKKALPQLSTSDRLKIHKGLIKISNSKNPGLAYGMFRRGIITISNFAASGTLYHEAFHSVMWTLLSENEREDLFDNAQEIYGLSSALALEESMAEDFRRYVQSEERPLIGKLVRAFRWLKHIWQNLRGKEPMLDKVFYSINRGKYANRKPQDSISTRFDINSRERESIKQQAIANGTFMLAPNGKPTNLTEDQWITVRTKAFKEWFGDWEKYAKLNDATVIWGHPASGKTYLFKQGREDIIDFDSEYKVRINKIMGLPEGADAKELRKAARNARKQEYHDLIMKLFDEAKAEAKRTGKKLLVSDMMLLKEREADIDVITNMSDEKFIERSAMRGETDATNKMLWKNDINDAMGKVSDKSKIINTEEFILDDLYGTNVSKVVDKNGEPLVVYHGGSMVNIFDTTGKYISAGIKKGDRGAYFTTSETSANHYENIHDYKYGDAIFAIIEEMKEAGATEKEIEDEWNTSMLGIRSGTRAFFLNIRNPKLTHYTGDYKSGYKQNNSNIENNDGQKITRNDTNEIEYVAFRPNQIKSATDNIGTFDSDNPDIRYRRVEGSENERLFRLEVQRFLDNFGITINDLDNYTGEEPLFDALDKVINITSPEDLSEGVGYAIAFMMQYQGAAQSLLSLDATFNNNLKGLRRGIKTRRNKGGISIPYLGKNAILDDSLKKLGKEISNELRKLYGLDEGKPSFFNKIWEVITEFFNMLTPSNKVMFNALKHYARHIANSVKLNDKSIIISGMVKPGTDTIAERVDIGKALRENPYEESIIRQLSNEGIALAGSASIALHGTLYRPKENPLHDIDFQAASYTKEQLDKIVSKISPYNTHIRTISKKEGEATETYLVIDRDFTLQKVENVEGFSLFEVLDKDGNKIGTLHKSDLILTDGVKGKLLDFFTGENQSPYGFDSFTINGQRYLISDPRNAFTAKLNWRRLKDIWDYNRYIPSSKILDTNTISRDNEELAQRISKAKIIWGHPAIGKTTWVEKHKDRILEWDEEVNPKRNEFIKNQIDPDDKLSEEEFKERKKDYMSHAQDHPEYLKFLTDEWEALKARAIKEGKQIFASPLPLLKMFMQDFDLVINLTNHEFMQRNQARGGKFYSSLEWKEAIDDVLVNVDSKKLVTTDRFFSDIMNDIELSQDSIEQYYSDKLELGNLTPEQLRYLEQRGITTEEYNRMSQTEREILFKCMV